MVWLISRVNYLARARLTLPILLNRKQQFVDVGRRQLLNLFKSHSKVQTSYGPKSRSGLCHGTIQERDPISHCADT